MLTSGTPVLVHVPTNTTFPDVTASTRIATISGTIRVNNQPMYTVNLQTTESGFPTNQKINLSPDHILPFIQPSTNKEMYYIGDTIIASDYVDTNNYDNPTVTVCKYPMGSGLRGTSSHLYRHSTSTVNVIKCPYAYNIVDFAHYESICLASIYTNRYIDDCIRHVAINGITTINNYLETVPSENITTLWNIALSRTSHEITHQQLLTIYLEYITLFFARDYGLTDSISGKRLLPLPINYVMTSLGFYGIIADDIKSNSSDRGCISYDYTIATQIRAGKYDLVRTSY